MSDRPILFSAPMVRALLAGRKAQTRRILTAACDEPPAYVSNGAICALDANYKEYRWPRTSVVGDRLWVREAWGHDAPDLDACRRGVESDSGISYGPYYMADANWFDNQTVRKRSAIQMPRWASRLTLTVTDVRVQRLQEISEEDAVAEGAYPCEGGRTFGGSPLAGTTACGAYYCLWNSLYGPDAWAENPWVVAISFEAHRCNIDQMPVSAAIKAENAAS